MSANAPIILVSPDMRPSVLGVARSLSESRLLQRFVTTIANGDGNQTRLFGILPERFTKKLADQLKRREVPSFIETPIDTVELPELINLTARRVGLGDVARHRIWEWAEQKFDETVARRWAGKAPVIYGCEHASVKTFRRQKEMGGFNILWQVIAHSKTVTPLLEEERRRFPHAVTAYDRELELSLPRIDARKAQQYEDADLIITNSDFARSSFVAAGVDAAKVKAVPTGCPPLATRNREQPNHHSPLIFLSAGSQSMRKGTHYLLSAWRRLQPANAELWLVGEMHLPSELLTDLPASVVIKPRVPRADLDELLMQASVLVLPTLAEGRAHIVLESLSAGLAIITTENSGCGDVVEDEVNGWKIAVRDTDALVAKLFFCINNRERLSEMQRQSLKKAAGWQQADFMKAHTSVIESFLAEREIAMEGQPQFSGMRRQVS